MKPLFFLSALTFMADAYWLMGAQNILTVQRLDPIVSPGRVASHVHAVLGGSNFGSTSTAVLRQSQCTSIPIPQDKSNYWVPSICSRWANGSFSSLDGGAVMSNENWCAARPHHINRLSFQRSGWKYDGVSRRFPHDQWYGSMLLDGFRHASHSLLWPGDPTLRTYNSNSFAQQAITFLCLDFNGVSTRHNGLPLTSCPSGIRAQINFPSCWDGQNVDSSNHQSHVAFLSEGPDKGTCTDSRYPVTLPRIFMEIYWGTGDFDAFRSQAMNTTQPFVFSYGDRTGYGYHADFINGWEAGVLQNAVNKCHCNEYGDPTCCAQQGIFDLTNGKTCRITPTVDEQVLGTVPKLPGNNPVQEEGTRATMFPAISTPALISPVYAYTGQEPASTGTIVSQATNIPVPASPTHLGDVPAASHSTLSASGVPYSSYPVLLATSMPSVPHSVTLPGEASVHTPTVSIPNTYTALKPSATPVVQSHSDDCHDNNHAGCQSDAPVAYTPVKPHHTTLSSHHAPGSNEGSCNSASRRKNSRLGEQRSSSHAVVSHHNAGHRFTKHNACTF
ncbi:hypothetical protein AX15_007345 [Amanita polypyramis BW_CC]|nr:hypothetical protein AX15_007345 [Amanita polypyramis BW_CC]